MITRGESRGLQKEFDTVSMSECMRPRRALPLPMGTMMWNRTLYHPTCAAIWWKIQHICTFLSSSMCYNAVAAQVSFSSTDCSFGVAFCLVAGNNFKPKSCSPFQTNGPGPTWALTAGGCVPTSASRNLSTLSDTQETVLNIRNLSICTGTTGPHCMLCFT